MCSEFCQSFAISFCPAPVLIMQFRMVQVWASRKFIGKSYGGFKFSSMVMKFLNFHEKLRFCWNSVSSSTSEKERFPEGLRPQNLRGTCAARNVQNFGDLTYSSGAWWLSWWCWWRVSLLSTWMFIWIWLVETAFFNEAVLSNILLPLAANLGQSWLVTIRIFGMVFWHVLAILSVVCVFLLSSLRF